MILKSIIYPLCLLNTINIPVYKFSTVVFNSVEQIKYLKNRGLITYGTQGSPSSCYLSNLSGKLEKGSRYCVLTPSGLFSIFICYLSFLKAGDYVLIPDNLYEPNYNCIIMFGKKFKINILVYNPLWSINVFISKFSHINKIGLIFSEIPGSITFETPNIKDIVIFSKMKNSILIADNSFSAGIGFSPLKFGFDISIQALTKYCSGGNDVLMGAIFIKDRRIYNSVIEHNSLVGSHVCPYDCNMIIRSIPTLKIRYLLHESKAKKIIKWFKGIDCVDRILNPFVQDCPGHIYWKEFFTNTSGIFSVVFKQYVCDEKITLFVNSLKIFKIGYSWGGYKSLVMLFKNVLLNRSNFCSIRNRLVVRFFIGLERTEELINDIKDALRVIY